MGLAITWKFAVDDEEELGTTSCQDFSSVSSGIGSIHRGARTGRQRLDPVKLRRTCQRPGQLFIVEINQYTGAVWILRFDHAPDRSWWKGRVHGRGSAGSVIPLVPIA